MVPNRKISIPPPILKEPDKYLLEFVWAGKKHEVQRDLLRADLEKGGLKLTNIQNKIAAQRMVWLTKLCNMEVLSFTRVFAEQLLGSFEGDYHGLDFINPIVVGLFDSTILVGGGAKKPPLPNSLLVIDRATKFGVLKASGMYFL